MTASARDSAPSFPRPATPALVPLLKCLYWCLLELTATSPPAVSYMASCCGYLSPPPFPTHVPGTSVLKSAARSAGARAVKTELPFYLAFALYCGGVVLADSSHGFWRHVHKGP